MCQDMADWGPSDGTASRSLLSSTACTNVGFSDYISELVSMPLRKMEDHRQNVFVQSVCLSVCEKYLNCSN